MQESVMSFVLIHLALVSTALAACNQDNCYRAFAAKTSSVSSFCSTYTTTINTATTALPTYASACSYSPTRVSSACSCLVPYTPPGVPACTPSPIVDFSVNNGDFNNFGVPVGGKLTTEPPWQTGTLQAASIDFENDGTSGTGPGNERYGQGFASFNMIGQAFGSGNMPASSSVAVLFETINFCELAYYNISFYARQTSPASQHCVIEIGWLDSNYGVEQSLYSSWTLYGPTKFESSYVGTAHNPDGTFTANLQIYVSCYGIKGVTPPATVQVAIDSLIIDPA